jgi:hypothetical protein
MLQIQEISSNDDGNYMDDGDNSILITLQYFVQPMSDAFIGLIMHEQVTPGGLIRAVLEHRQHGKMAILVSSVNFTFHDGNTICNDVGIACSGSHKYDTCIRAVVQIDCSAFSQLEYITLIHDECHRTHDDYGDLCTMNNAELEYVYGNMAVDMLFRIQGTISIGEVDSTVGAEVEIADTINTKFDTTINSETDPEVDPNEFCCQIATQQF